MNQNKYKLALLAILTGTFLVPVNSTMIAVGIPTIASDLGVSMPQISWVVTIYLIMMAVAQPIAGKLGDIYGNKLVMLVGFGLFFLASIACAFSYNLISLILFRGIQALGGALATPNATAIIRYIIPKEKLSGVFGIFGLAMGLGAAIGPLLGSGLISMFGWEAVFWVNIPFLVFAISLSAWLIPNVGIRQTHSMDILGSICLAVLLTILTLFVTHGEVFFQIGYILAFASFLFVFIWHERRTDYPLIEFSMFRNKSFSRSNISILLNNFVMYSTVLFVPILLTDYHFKIGAIGSLLFYFSLAMALASMLGGKIASRYGKERTITWSFVLTVLIVGLYFGLIEDVSYLYVTVVLIAGGFSAGLGVASMQATNMESVPKEKSGTASGIYSTFRYIGGMLASAVVSVFVGSMVLYVVLLVAAVVGVVVSAGMRGEEVLASKLM